MGKSNLVLWARVVLEKPDDYLILDTETTGITVNDVVIQLGIIDLRGNVVLDSLIKPHPSVNVGVEATRIHGINVDMLENAPLFGELYPKLKEIIVGKKVLIYNADFDLRLLKQTCLKEGLHLLDIDADCVMLKYSEYVGQWSGTHNDFKFQKLKGGNHTAIGDCRATHKVIKKMSKEMNQNDLYRVNSGSPTIVSNLTSQLQELERTEQKKSSNYRRWWEFWK